MMFRCVLWDFGDTLVDQDWMLTPPEGFPDWPRVWVDVARGENEPRWNLGDVDTEEIASVVGERLGMPLAGVMGHIDACCRGLRFFAAPRATALRCPLPQAIVTLNPDVFRRYVVPAHRLDEVFSVIVTSSEERTLDKTALSAIALERLDGRIDRNEALLIDNVPENVEAWERSGGAGYLYRDEASFAADLRGPLARLVAGQPATPPGAAP